MPHHVVSDATQYDSSNPGAAVGSHGHHAIGRLSGHGNDGLGRIVLNDGTAFYRLKACSSELLPDFRKIVYERRIVVNAGDPEQGYGKA